MTQTQINAIKRLPGAETLFVSKKGLSDYATDPGAYQFEHHALSLVCIHSATRGRADTVNWLAFRADS